MSLMARGHESDLPYIDKELRAQPPALAAHVATLLRDRVLHKAVAKAAAIAQGGSLGRKLPANSLRFRALPQQTKQEFLDKMTAEPLAVQAANGGTRGNSPAPKWTSSSSSL